MPVGIAGLAPGRDMGPQPRRSYTQPALTFSGVTFTGATALPLVDA
jgi:hypothetical protein